MTNILITSALPYINGVKHLGNLVGSLLPADVHARFRRQVGDTVLFICGTDEHGTPAELGAAQAGQDVRSYCDEQHALQADVYRQQLDNAVRSFRPVTLGRVLFFRLPEAAEGPSIQAELDGEPIVFALSPQPTLTWADCSVRSENDKSRAYRCELQAPYVFR